MSADDALDHPFCHAPGKVQSGPFVFLWAMPSCYILDPFQCPLENRYSAKAAGIGEGGRGVSRFCVCMSL
jgi:hypothetical protein